MKLIMLILFLIFNVIANEVDYLEGLRLYEAKKYHDAFPIILKEARFDNYAAQYRVADM
jgi:ribosomal protein L7/L12